MAQISQRQAREYRRRMIEAEATLQRQKSRWVSEWTPGWVNIETLFLSDASFARIETARKLGHAVIAVPGGRNNEVMFYAEKL